MIESERRAFTYVVLGLLCIVLIPGSRPPVLSQAIQKTSNKIIHDVVLKHPIPVKRPNPLVV
jgi:K+-transporting ATPase A subunit